MGRDADARRAFHAIRKGNYPFERESKGGKSKTVSDDIRENQALSFRLLPIT